MNAADAISEGCCHASAVAQRYQDGWRAALLLGEAGSGKSDLALRLIDRGWQLVGDDQLHLRRGSAAPLASPPETLAGKIAVAGVGITECEYLDEASVGLVVQLESSPPSHPLDNMLRSICGFRVPLLRLGSFWPSAPILVERKMALTIGKKQTIGETL